MSLDFLFKGLLLGFSIAAPVGPIGILCIRRTLQYGRLSGFSSGLGAAVADMLYGIIAASGLTLISDFLLKEQLWLRLIGGGFLIYLGGKTFFSKTTEKMHAASHKSLLSDFVSTFFLTITNPMTILAFLAVFAALGLGYAPGQYSQAIFLVLGIFLGSALWWIILSEGVTLFRKKVSQRVMIWINRLAGIVIAVFGLIAWISLMR